MTVSSYRRKSQIMPKLENDNKLYFNHIKFFLMF